MEILAGTAKFSASGSALARSAPATRRYELLEASLLSAMPAIAASLNCDATTLGLLAWAKLGVGGAGGMKGIETKGGGCSGCGKAAMPSVLTAVAQALQATTYAAYACS
jgi:hypothetical protein